MSSKPLIDYLNGRILQRHVITPGGDCPFSKGSLLKYFNPFNLGIRCKKERTNFSIVCKLCWYQIYFLILSIQMQMLCYCKFFDKKYSKLYH